MREDPEKLEEKGFVDIDPASLGVIHNPFRLKYLAKIVHHALDMNVMKRD
jgi:hypothetical protein